MDQQERDRIVEICKEFVSGFDFELNGSAWLIVDPLSGYLQEIEGIENYCLQWPATNERTQVLLLQFDDGSYLIPAGKDLGVEGVENWMWILPENNHLLPLQIKQDA